MGLFGEIKCGRCDRKYSAARSRCPYCGARKSRSGRRIDTTDANGKWKLIAGIILLLVIVVAVVVVILISINDKKNATPQTDPSAQVSDSAEPSGGVNSVETTPLPSDSAEPSDSPEPTDTAPVVTDIILNREDFTMSSIGESWSLDPTLVPDTADVTITWTSSDESVALVDLYGKVTAIGNGMATVTASAGGVTKECIVRVSAG